ncbi:MAG: AraC family transcriptional regulator [Opitutaceae bacterium]|nr:AraC family transcriptional regulator [Opitutaceae bacterium]
MPLPPVGNPAKLFQLPTTSSGHGKTLTVGHSVSLYYDLQPPNTWPEHTHSLMQIVLALDPVDAEMRWHSGGRWITESTKTPHVWLVPARIVHAAEWKGSAAMLSLYVESDYIHEECGCDLTKGAVRDLGPLTQRSYLTSCLCRKFHNLCHGSRSYSRILVAASGTLLAALLLRAHLCPGNVIRSRKRGLSDDRLQRVTDYVETHVRDPLSRALLAQVAGLTEYHFSRMFKISTGLPPMKHVWRCRIHRARQLLETGEWKVAAVAAETGYCDQSHLDRQFRKEFGCSPGSVIPLGLEG